MLQVEVFFNHRARIGSLQDSLRVYYNASPARAAAAAPKAAGADAAAEAAAESAAAPKEATRRRVDSDSSEATSAGPASALLAPPALPETRPFQLTGAIADGGAQWGAGGSEAPDSKRAKLEPEDAAAHGW